MVNMTNKNNSDRVDTNGSPASPQNYSNNTESQNGEINNGHFGTEGKVLISPYSSRYIYNLVGCKSKRDHLDTTKYSRNNIEENGASHPETEDESTISNQFEMNGSGLHKVTSLYILITKI
jgi:hypothetical protein